MTDSFFLCGTCGYCFQVTIHQDPLAISRARTRCGCGGRAHRVERTVYERQQWLIGVNDRLRGELDRVRLVLRETDALLRCTR